MMKTKKVSQNFHNHTTNNPNQVTTEKASILEILKVSRNNKNT